MLKKHYYYLDFLRIIAAYGVVVFHFAARGLEYYPISSIDWLTADIFVSAFRFNVPVFFMISGSIFLNPSKTVTYKILWQKHIKKLIIFFLLWSSFYTILNIIVKHTFSSVKDMIYYFIKATLSGENTYQFWFLFVIIGLYLITPFLRKIVVDEQLLKIFLIISFITAIVLPTIKVIPYIGAPIFDYFEKFELTFTVGYIFYYVLGYYIHTHVISKNNNKKLMALMILMVLVTAILTFMYSKSNNQLNDTFYQKKILNIAIIGTSVFCIAKSMENMFANSNIWKNILSTVPKYMLGVYAMHVLFITLFKRIGLLFLLPEIISVIIFPMVTFIACCFITSLLYKMPKIFRYLI